MTLLEIYADDKGESHFREVHMEMTEREFAPPARPVGLSAETPSTSSVFLEAPPGWDDAFHTTPRRQLAVLLEGRLKVSCSDGQSITMSPGDVVLLSDTSGKGHLSEVQGDDPTHFLLVGLAG